MPGIKTFSGENSAVGGEECPVSLAEIRELINGELPIGLVDLAPDLENAYEILKSGFSRQSVTAFLQKLLEAMESRKDDQINELGQSDFADYINAMAKIKNFIAKLKGRLRLNRSFKRIMS